jgi:hypothetical protein
MVGRFAFMFLSLFNWSYLYMVNCGKTSPVVGFLIVVTMLEMFPLCKLGASVAKLVKLFVLEVIKFFLRSFFRVYFGVSTCATSYGFSTNKIESKKVEAIVSGIIIPSFLLIINAYTFLSCISVRLL